MLDWVRESGARVAIVFEGRDAAGKGGAIKRIQERRFQARSSDPTRRWKQSDEGYVRPDRSTMTYVPDHAATLTGH